MLATPWISRLVALLLMAAVVLAFFMLIVEPLRSAYATADAAIAEARETLLRYERIASLRASLEQQVADLARAGGTANSYLGGETDALAAAALQRRVASLFASSGGGVSSVQVLPTREEAGLRRVAIRLQFSSTIEPLVRILHELEVGRPALFIDNLDIRSRSPIGGVEAGADLEPELDVSLDLYGFLPSAAPSAEAAAPPPDDRL